MGFSWGGLSNVVAAARDPRIKALVSLDGSLRYFSEPVDGGKDAARNVTPARVALPLLYLGAAPAAAKQGNGKDKVYSFMDEMTYSDVYLVSLMPMRHHDFASYNQRFAQDDQFGKAARDQVALADLPELPCSAEGALRLKNGNPGRVLSSAAEYGEEAWASYLGQPLAVGIYRAGELHPSRVFNLG